MTNHELAIIEYTTTKTPIKEICKKYGISDRVIYKAIKSGRISKRSRDICCEKIFNNKELMFYILGFVASDGYLYEEKKHIEIGVHIKDTELLVKLSNLIYGKDRTIKEEKRNRVRLFLYGNETYTLFKEFGLTQRKSETLKIRFDKIPKEYFRHFFRGYFDGDGCYWIFNSNNASMRLVGNKNTIENFKKYTELYYGIPSYVYSIKTSSNFQMYQWSLQKTSLVKKIVNILYKDATIYLERKYNKIKEFVCAV